jgi:hypothetical protein
MTDKSEGMRRRFTMSVTATIGVNKSKIFYVEQSVDMH